MAQIITMPRLSDTMTEGVVATWLKKVGDTIKTGDILAEIETDKATMEFESFYDGVLLHIGIPEGQSAPVDSLLAIVGKSGEDISALLASRSSAEATEEKVEVKEELPTPNSQLPANVKVITMPRLSDTMTTGTVATWLKKIGDTVKEGDILAEIETDKATMEFESFNAGTLLYIGIQEGDSAPVDAVLAILGPAGTDVSGLAANYKVGAVAEATKAEEKPIYQAETANNTIQSSTTTDRIFASPLAKKIAQDKGINLAQVKGSGENGRIVKNDIENFSPSSASPAAAISEATATVAAVKPFVPAGEMVQEELKNSQMRKTIARRLSESKFTAPHYYLTIELDMDNAIASRNMINGLPETKVSFNDMVIKASAMALKKHPQVNSQWTEDAMVINYHLAGKAKSKKIHPSEMEGSTFTISNLGMFGIQSFTSIINQPNSAILSVGAIIEKPVVKNGQIVVGNTMTVTLACDHRTVDGATGAQFLQTFKAFMENPVTMLA